MPAKTQIIRLCHVKGSSRLVGPARNFHLSMLVFNALLSIMGDKISCTLCPKLKGLSDVLPTSKGNEAIPSQPPPCNVMPVGMYAIMVSDNTECLCLCQRWYNTAAHQSKNKVICHQIKVKHDHTSCFIGLRICTAIWSQFCLGNLKWRIIVQVFAHLT